MNKPNVIFIFADQLRYQATGFGGDANVQTPHLDRLANQSLNFITAVSGCPVCSPARASLLTGQYPDKHGVFVNDVCLSNDAVSLAESFKDAGYDTAYIGKWHIDGHGRSNYIPPERRHGFDFWRVLECTHQYNQSHYYAGDDTEKRLWDGYDAIVQTREAQQYIQNRATQTPFFLTLSWGPPHAPYQTAPEGYNAMYTPEALELHPNVPTDIEEQARRDLAGYYAHITALDDLIRDLLETVKQCEIADNTVFVFWSDHGDMLGSQGEVKKQRPWDESIRVPLLIHYPERYGQQGRRITTPINTPDLMPTLLGMCGIPSPDTVQGNDYTPFLDGKSAEPATAALIACYHPFGQYTRNQGGKEYRGVRTEQYTYVRDLNGPWLLYDNAKDPFQLENRIGNAEYHSITHHLDQVLEGLLNQYEDAFLSGAEYINAWGYVTDENGTVPYTN
jgi:arylsulfatase A-like enzyme